MKKVFAALLCFVVTAAPAFAGEDSTERWGDGGTGPAYWESPCGLAQFEGNVPMPEKCRPVRGRSAQTSAPAAPAPAATAPAPAAPVSRAAD